MALARVAAQDFDTLRSLVRDEVGDPDTDADGNAISSGSRRWTDTHVEKAINLQLIEMQTLMGIQLEGEGLLSADVSYGAGEETVALGASVGAEAVLKVDDVTGTSVRRLSYVSPVEIEDYALVDVMTVLPTRVWTLVSSGTSYALQIRPTPSAALTLRVWYFAAPIIAGAGTDAHLLAARWHELITVGAAFKLLSRDDECSDQMLKRRQELMDEFTMFAKRIRGPERVRVSRRAR